MTADPAPSQKHLLDVNVLLAAIYKEAGQCIVF